MGHTRRDFVGLCLAATLFLSAPGLHAFLVGEDRLVTDLTDQQFDPAVAYTSVQDQFLVVFRLSGTPAEIWGQRVTREGLSVGDAFPIATTDTAWPPALAYSANSDVFLLAWTDRRNWDTHGFDIYARRIAGAHNGGDGGGQLIGGEISLAMYPENQAVPDVAFDTENNQFLVVWDEDRPLSLMNNKTRISGRRVRASDGALLGGEIQITDGAHVSERPVVDYSPPDDSFLVVWSEYSRAWAARRVSVTGALVGDLFDIGPTAVSVQRAAVAYAPGHSQLLVAFPWNGQARARRVAGVRDGGDGGGQLLGDEVALGPSDLFTFCGLDFIPDLGHWLVIWDDSADPFACRGAWVDTAGEVRLGGYPLSWGSDIAVGHSLTGTDAAWIFHSAPFPGPSSPFRALGRRVPQLVQGDAECSTIRYDFLRCDTVGVNWNMIAALPAPDFSVDLRIFPRVRFFTGDPLATSDYEGSGRAEVIAVNGNAAGSETLNLLLEVNQYDPATVRVEHTVAGITFGGDADITRTLDTEGRFLDAWGMDVTEGEHRVINVIPQSEDLDINLAVFEPGTVPLAQYTGLTDLPSNRKSQGTNPGRVETVYLVAPVTGRMGLAVWAGVGEGDYRLVIRDPDEPTSEEIILYLLGRAGIPWGGDVNGDAEYGDPGIDVADVVANILAGR
jgi:hypothetical protein